MKQIEAYLVGVSRLNHKIGFSLFFEVTIQLSAGAIRTDINPDANHVDEEMIYRIQKRMTSECPE